MFDRWLPRAPRRSTAAGVLLVFALVLAALSVGGPSKAKSAAPACAANANLVYACGVLWGVHTKVQTDAAATSLESKVGRRFDIIYDYHTVSNRVPTPQEQMEVEQGHILHITDTPAQFSWAQVAAGAADSTLRSQALGIKALHVPVFFSFDHEMDAKADANRGTPAQYVAAYRHVYKLFAAAGVKNAIWVWIVTGYAPHAPVWAKFYPGNAYVDWISGENYAGVNCPSVDTQTAANKTFSQGIDPFSSWAHSSAARAVGIPSNMPEMLSEYAAAYDAAKPTYDAQWYAGIAAALKSHPDLHAIALWDSTGGKCSYSLDDKPYVLAAFAKSGHNPYVNVARG